MVAESLLASASTSSLMKTDDELIFLDELEAIESNTLHLVVG